VKLYEVGRIYGTDEPVSSPVVVGSGTDRERLADLGIFG
jgi:hypothetical protein